MKKYVSILVFIFVGIAAFTVYGLLTFQPDEVKPFVFNEPKLPPELIQNDEADKSAPLTGEEEERKKLAMQQMELAVDGYKFAVSAAAMPVKTVLGSLVSRMESWDIPAYFLSSASAQGSGQRSFEKLMLNVAEPSTMTVSSSAPVDCAGGKFTVLVGDAAADKLVCGQERIHTGDSGQSAEEIFIAGPGNDTISDAAGNRIVGAGSGDDTITLGVGRSIIVLEPSWGHDTVTVDCKEARVAPNEIPAAAPVPWTHSFANFIVLGEGLDPKDVVWKGNVLTSIAGGDTLTVNENCFAVVPMAQ